MSGERRDLFHHTPDGSLDRQFLRVCAVHRLLARRRIGKSRALELLAQRRVSHHVALVELWRGNHMRDMLP